jgi:ubiquinone biosynthesis protein
MKIPRVDKGYRNLRRTRQILAVFAKHGFAEILDRMGIAARVRIIARLRGRKTGDVRPLSAPRRLRLALEALGPTFIKVGQLLSTRSFLLPPPFIEELSKLQDKVQPIPFDQVKDLVEKELNGSLETLFQSFDSEPIASASMALAYKATLPSGEQVIVKVQRPKIIPLIETDMSILHDLVVLIERHIEESRQYNPVALVEELRRSMRREVDFMNEARHIEQFAANFKNVEPIHVPKVYWDFCTSKIVTLEFIDGLKISEVELLRESGAELKQIAQAGTKFILKQIFEDGFFHADPHPGNLFFTKEGKIAPVDFGIMGRLDEWLMDEISDLLIAVWRRDIDLLIRVLVDLGALAEEADPQALRAELSEFLHRYYGLSLKKIEMRSIIGEGLDIVTRHSLRVPSNLLLLAKTIGTYEDLVRKLDPQYNFINEIRPYLRKLALRRLNPEKLGWETAKTVRDLYDLIKMMPRELELILRRMRHGRMAIEFQHRGLENFIQEMDRSSNRLSFSLIIASLIVASSLIMILNKGPFFLGYPLLGIIGYVFAGILGIGLALAILRSGKF